ncbi:glycosyltransferase [Fodinibius sp. SL11]|uniref:glycosyltransferase n=1 Tax=Fodinibius sp. SL11 TaxID=3425690 RepID=UPI003F882E47
MRSKKILLVGNANHQFVANYAKWLKKESNEFEVDVLSDRPVKIDSKKFYNKIFHLKFEAPLFKIVNKFKGIRRYYRFFLYVKLLKELPNYEYVHFHFLNVDSGFLATQVKKYLGAKVIISIWGSDFYRVKERDKKYFENACQTADKITFTNSVTRDNFINSLDWNKDNLRVCRFGLAPLEVLKQLNKSKRQCKRDLGWDPETLSITIGYNSNPAQQHIKIIEQFNKSVLTKCAQKIELILPLTYGSDDTYKNKIETVLEKSPFEYRIYRDYLTDQKVAEIRQASDIMIQLQKTDQFSGSMQEHLYAGDIVITGSWLPYQTMKDYGAYFLEVDNIEELVDLVPEVVDQYKGYRKKTKPNSNAIERLSSWETNIKDWIALYN